jgi:DNA-binding NarL/FixJ family response regulator
MVTAALKVMVVDDHPLVRDAMAGLLRQLARDVVVVEAADAAGALAAARANHDLSLVFLDLNLPGTRGFDALDRLRLEHPALPVVILSMHHDPKAVLEALRRGAVGYIPKSTARELMLHAARLVLAGGVYVPADVLDADPEARNDRLEFASPLAVRKSARDLDLTSRQGEVLGLMMRGQVNKEICRSLGLAERTVKIHVTAVLGALKVSTRTQAVIAAAALGFDPDELLTHRPDPPEPTPAPR